MKKKRLLGKVVSLVLAAAMTVTMLPQDFTLTVRAAEETEADSGTESSTNEEEVLAAESSEEESSTVKETESEIPEEEESSTVKETESKTAEEAETESISFDADENDNTSNERTGHVVNGKDVTFTWTPQDNFFAYWNEGDVYLATSDINRIIVKGGQSDWVQLAELIEGNDGAWTGSATLSSGAYNYKFFAYRSDNENGEHYEVGDNRSLVIDGILDTKITVLKNAEFSLSPKLNGYKDGAASEVAVFYGLSSESSQYSNDVEITGDVGNQKLMVKDTLDENINSIILTATDTTDSNNTCIVEVNIQAKEYEEDTNIKSPVVDAVKGEVTFNYFNPTAKEVLLAGNMTEWQSNAVPLKFDKNTGYWSETVSNLAPGEYEYKFIVDGNWITDPLNVSEVNGNSAFEVPNVSGNTSPEIEGKDVTFIYENNEATAVSVAGTMTNPQWGDGAVPMDKDETDGYWKLTMQDVAPGKYQYKFVVTIGEKVDWVTDPWNSNPKADGNSVFAIAGMANAEVTLYKNQGKAELPSELSVYDEEGNTTSVAVTYAIAPVEGIPADSIKLETADGTTTVSITETFPAEATEFALTATSEDGKTSTVTVEVMEKQYTYTIYWYSYAGHTLEDSALWVWEENGAPGKEFSFNGSEQIGENTWLKAELEIPYTYLGMIPKVKSEDPLSPVWTWQDSDHLYNNKDKADATTLYLVEGTSKPYTELPELEKREARYLIVEYIRNEGTAENWYFYTWNNGGTEFNPFVKTEDNRWIATVPVKWGLDSISFCIERADMSTGEPVHWAEKDGNDYLCSMPVDQNIVKIVMEEGKGITKTFAYNKGYEIEPLAETIHFYYRDNNKFLQGNDGGFASVKVEVNGTEYDMVFDAEEQRYAYDMTGLQPGEYAYRYILKETEETEVQYVLDDYNSEKVTIDDIEYSLCKYEKYEAEVTASILNPTMDYNDNNVLTVEFKAKGEADITGMKAERATADLSELGGSSNTAIDTELLKLSIAVREGIPAGEKTIPVTIYDQYKNEYKAEAKVTVTERDKSGDFDWDEAVIYFAVTDRFFDGNESNNANVDKNGPSSYHGGDFAGLTQKLDYLKDLGINTIWITPIVENAMDEGLATDVEGITSWGYHGYWASNFEKIDSHLGTEEEFKALLNEAHNRGIKIMVDVVLNHSGYGEQTKKYFNETFKDKDENVIRMLREADEMVSGSDQMTSLSGLPDFLTENSEVRDLLVAWQSNWISKYDIDYYRIDTVKHVDDTTWSAFKNALTAIDPDFKMIGEWAGAGYATDTGMLGTGRMDSLLDFDFNDKAQSFANGDLSSVESFLQGRNAALNNTATLGQFMSSHDEDGLIQKLISENNIPEERAMELFKVAASLQITAKGQPVIYYGEEVGQYGANNYPYQTNRYDFDWSRVHDDNEMLSHYKKLLSIRNQYTEVFAKGSRSAVEVNNEKQYDIFARSYGDTTIYVGLNNAQEAQSVTFDAPAAVYQDLYSGEYYNTDEKGKLTVEIPAAADGGTVVLLKTEYGAGNLWVSRIPDQTYTGSAIKLDANSLVVRIGGRKLEAGKDYTVSYKNNKNVSSDASKASVTIKGKGNFTEQKTVEFNIVKKDINSSDVVLTCNDVLAYNANKAQNAAPKLKYGKLTLKANKDYTTVYYKKADYETNPEGAEKLTTIKDEGSYVMVITAVESGNYKGSIVKDITITNKTLIKGASITLSASSVSYVDYSDVQKRPQVTKVKVKGKEIDPSAYEVSYTWNGEVGKAAAVVTIKPDNEDYTGSVEKTFKVTGEKLSSVAIVDSESIKNIDYDKAIAETTAGMTQSAPALKAKTANTEYSFEAGKDYTVSYKNNKKAGKATVTFTGKGRYTGTINATFQINAKVITENDTALSIMCAEQMPYSKAGSKPEITVRYDGKLLGKNDYSVAYRDNKNLTDSAKAVITFKGNYKGTATKTFKVVQQELENTVITVKDVMYNAKPGKAFAVPVVKESNGKALKAGTDYDKTYVYTYVNETTVKNAEQDIVRVSGDAVDKNDIIPENTLIMVTVNTVAGSNYTGSKSAVYNVMKANIAKAKIKIADKEYTGYQISLNESDFTEFKLNGTLYTVKLDGNRASLTGPDNTLADGGFEIVSYDKNINKGTAKVTLKGTGSFGGTVTRTFKIKANGVNKNWFQELARILFGI